ncbi:hypothetical protein MN608_04722 [Microdochium nivale]|nr:hypothetical protein MN608_04722 [Microdochium nivale]
MPRIFTSQQFETSAYLPARSLSNSSSKSTVWSSLQPAEKIRLATLELPKAPEKRLVHVTKDLEVQAMLGNPGPHGVERPMRHGTSVGLRYLHIVEASETRSQCG